MSDRVYDRIVGSLLLIVVASVVAWDHITPFWQVVLGAVAVIAAVGSVVLHFLHVKTPKPFESVVKELAQGLQDGSIVLRKTAHISVTQELIDQDGHHCRNCPVFNAMEAAGVPVYAVQMWTWSDKNMKYHDLPKGVGDWIVRYDSFDGTPTPFEFDIEWEVPKQ